MDLNPPKLDLNPMLGIQIFLSKGLESLTYKFESLKLKTFSTNLQRLFFEP